MYKDKKERMEELFNYYTDEGIGNSAAIERIYWEARTEPDEGVYETNAQRIIVQRPGGGVMMGWRVAIFDIGAKLAEGVGPTYMDALEDALGKER